MCRTNFNVSTGRFHSQGFQDRVVQALGEIPAGLECPLCSHNFDIVVSRRQVVGGILSRRLLRHYRCRICNRRFSQANLEAVRNLASRIMVTPAISIIAFLPGWRF